MIDNDRLLLALKRKSRKSVRAHLESSVGWGTVALAFLALALIVAITLKTVEVLCD